MERDHLWVTDDEHNSTIQIPKQTGSKTKNIVIHVKLRRCTRILHVPTVTYRSDTMLGGSNTGNRQYYSITCLIRNTKVPGKCVGLDRMSDYSGFTFS